MTFDEVFAAYSIHPKHWSGMLAIVLADVPADIELAMRLLDSPNYVRCLRDLMAGTRDHSMRTAVIPFESLEVENGDEY